MTAAKDLRKRADAAHKRGSKELSDDLHAAARREEASAASLPHGQLFDLSDHIAAALELAEKIDRERESIDSTTLVAHLRIIAEDYTDAAS